MKAVDDSVTGESSNAGIATQHRNDMGNAEDTRSHGTDQSTDQEELASLLEPQQRDHNTLGQGDIFELLKNQRRRWVINYLLHQAENRTTLDVLAEHIAAKENEIEVSQLSSSQRKRVYIGLYQCHLPKMDEFGIISYQKSRGVIELNEIDHLKPYLNDFEGTQHFQHRLHYTVPFVGLVLVGLTILSPIGAIPLVVWTILGILAPMIITFL